MKIRLFLVLLLLMSFSTFSQATCIPAPDPDLNNDGIVNSADLVIVTRSNGVAKGNPRYNPLADTNCDGKINPIDIHFVNKAFGQTFPIPSNINVTGVLEGIDSFSFRLGNEAGKSITVRLSSGAGDTPFSVRMTQTIQSATGLVLSPNLTGKELFDDDGDGYINERLGQGMTATIPGEYTITTTATVIGTGKVFTHTAHVKVYGVNEPYVDAVVSSNKQLFLLSGAIQQQVQIGVGVSGEDDQQVTSVDIKQLENGAIFPAQKQSDNYYEGTVSINTQGLVGGECFNYAALIHTPKGTAQPKYTHPVCATTIPIGFNRERRKESTESITGLIFANNMVTLSFKPGTLEPRMKQIAASVNGTLIGQMEFIHYYQMELKSSFPLFQDLEAIVEKLKTFPEVNIVGASVKSGSLSSTTFANDPLFQSNLQPNLNRIRADEAWWVNRGSSDNSIMVLDSGIDPTHPDLIDKVTLGKNYVTNGQSIDDHYHGTHVAGIIAAITGNGEGVASVAPNSFVTAVKVTDKTRLIWYEDMAAAILWSANPFGNKNAHIINVSAGVPEHPLSLTEVGVCSVYWNLYKGKTGPCDSTVARNTICDAVAGVVTTGNLVIAAAGNDNKNEKSFPAACSGAVAVGATEIYSNERWIQMSPIGEVPITVTHGSNYGDWVTLAAPGSTIYSTVPSINEVKAEQLYGLQYARTSGTSQATPHVSGALAVLLGRHPEWKENRESMQAAVDRLQKTAKPLPDTAQLGAGRIDVFEAVFNGNFEITKPEKAEELVEWQQHPNISRICSSKTDRLGILPVAAANNKRMLVCDNTAVRFEGIMNELDIPEGVTQLPISFDWRMVAEDLNANGSVKTTLVNGSQFIKRDDRVVIRVYNTETKTLSMVDVIPLSLLLSTYNSGQPLVQASNGWYGNNWQTFTPTAPIPVTKGKNQLQIQIINSGLNSTGDAIDLQGTTLFMMDRLRFRLN